MMKNKKGMTLIEEIIAMAIIAIASLIMFVGFSTAGTIFSDSEQFKNNTNDQYAALIGNEKSDKVSLNTTSTRIKISAGGKTVRVDGNYVKTSVKDNNDAALVNYNFESLQLNNTPQTYSNVLRLLGELLPIYGNNNQLDLWFTELCKDMNVPKPDTKYYFSNDNYRLLYYYMFGQTHLTLEQDVIDRCNRIYDTQHPSPSTDKEKNARIGEQTLYIRPYFLGGLKNYWDKNKNNDDIEEYFILVAAPSNGYKQNDGWRTSLVYNSKDKHWYYKLFPANLPSYQVDANAAISIASFTDTNITMTNLINGVTVGEQYIQLSDQTQWKRIE